MTKKRGPGTIGGTLDEIRAGTFHDNARHRASRRKSKWNLLLPAVILPLWLGLWWVAVEFGCLAHILFSGGVVPRLGQWMKVLSSGMSLAHALILFAPVIPALTTAMVIGNYLVYWVAPARRALNAEAADFPGTEYSTGQRELSRVTAYTAPVALLLSLLGAWLL